MALSNKTTISTASIPADVLLKPSLKLIILSTDESIVIKADTVAQNDPIDVERCVVWVKDFDRNALVKQIPGLVGKIDNCIAFSLSTINKIGLLINKNDVIDWVILGMAYTEAGKSDLN